jgi:SHS family lactate transporter-like MFS transporter
MPSDVSSRAKIDPVSAVDRRNALIASFLGWTLDAFDFFIVVMVLTEIAGTFHKTIGALALSLTVTLAFRPVGAFLFGLMADRYGRRIPLMIDVVFYSIIEIASGLAPNYTTFLILRALFGIGMGGEWGVGASLAMEAVPSRWRGILSGVLQEGYAVGYLLAACAYRFVEPHFGWRAMFFIGGLPAILAWFIRRRVKESAAWERSRRKDWSALWDAVRSHTGYYAAGAAIVCALDSILSIWTHAAAQGAAAAGSDFWLRAAGVFVIAAVVLFMADVTWHVAEGHRKLFLYLVALMAMMNFASHGTQDLYPTFLKVQRGFSPQLTALVSIIANLGALAGGICIGLFSDRLGRRRGMITSLLLAVVVIPLWAFAPTTGLLMLGAFLIQFGVQGAWGVIPAHITELSPDSVRGFLPGFAYQCGVLIAGTVPYLEDVLARSLNYDKAMAATAVTVFLVCAVVISLGKEKKGVEFGA